MINKLNREELARLEVGNTTVSPALARTIVCCFLLIIFVVPILQMFFDFREPERETVVTALQSLVVPLAADTPEQVVGFARIIMKNSLFLEAMNDFEKWLEEGSFLHTRLLSPGQKILLSLGYGNEKVYPGKDSWLFYRPDMDYLMGPPFLDPVHQASRVASSELWEKAVQPDPVAAIKKFNAQLSSRGIELVVVATPVKAELHPEYFYSSEFHPPLQNSSWDEFVVSLKEAGVLFFDAASVLADRGREYYQKPLYLQTDTHWRPEAMEQVARELAAFIRKHITLSADDRYVLSRQQKKVMNRGDIDVMLRLTESSDIYPEEEVQIQQVITSSQELWQASSDAELLLLGDSFSNIYSLGGMGWGEGAGFGEQLSYYLQAPIDMILQNDAGAYATREVLARELARGKDRLENKKVVIWQFASRELTSGDWKMIGMDFQEQPESDFYTPSPGTSVTVSAIVASISRSPVPGSVPYKDNIVSLHLEDIRDLKSGEPYGQALVYGWGMRGNNLMPLARLRPGEQIEIKLVDWDLVQREYSSYRRSTLDDEMLELELPVWGEMLP